MSLTNASYQTITVPFGTVDGTATVAGNDYTATSGTLTISSGATSGTIVVPVIGDTMYEPDETFSVTLGTPTGAVLGTSQGTGQIINDDPMPTVSIAGFTASDGNSRHHGIRVPREPHESSYQAIMVPFGTVDGTATVAGNDYTATSGTLTISSGSTGGTIVVPVIGDTMYETDETFFVTLGTPTGALLGTSQGTGQITNDDPMPTVSIAGFTASEGNTGTTGFGFTRAPDERELSGDHGSVSDGGRHSHRRGKRLHRDERHADHQFGLDQRDDHCARHRRYEVRAGRDLLPSRWAHPPARSSGQARARGRSPTTTRCRRSPSAGFTASEGNSGTTGFAISS